MGISEAHRFADGHCLTKVIECLLDGDKFNGLNMKDIVTGAREEEDTRPLLRRSITLQSAVIAYF